MKSKKLFLDFDECMAHSFCADDEKHADQLIDLYGEHWRGEKFMIPPSAWDMTMNQGWYATFKRSWTDALLTFSRQLVGNENVFILTSSTSDYIRHCNVSLELGFDNSHIFSREDLFTHDKHPEFLDTHNVLVDNLPYRDQCSGWVSKVSFLNTLPEPQYVKVMPFEVWHEKIGYQGEYFENLKDRIMSALEY